MTRLETFFLKHLWPGLAAWVALYISDYAMTIKCARLYQAGVSESIVFEGSYEITPYFQRDINSLRRISPRFLAALALTALALAGIYWVSREITTPQLYDFVLGAFISMQLAIHTRHFRNFFQFRAILHGRGARGRMEYPRVHMLQLSALELLVFAGMFTVLFLFTGSWFLLGGTLGCLSIAQTHWRLARRRPSRNPAEPSK